MPNEQNATLGGAQVFIDDVDIGYTDGDIEFDRSLELKPLKDGIPLITVLQVPIEEKIGVKIPAVEITPDHIVKSSLNLAMTTNPGTEVTIATGAPQTKTAIALPWAPGLIGVILDGPNVTTLVIKEGASTISASNYIADTLTGIVVFLAAAGVVAGDELTLSYKYTPPEYTEIALGTNLPIVNRKVKLVHESPVSGNIIQIELWKCQGSGHLPLSFKKTEWMHLDFDMNATPDKTNHPTKPVGYIRYIPKVAA